MDGVREETGEYQRSMGIWAKLKAWGGATYQRKEPCFGCREDGRAERRRLRRTGMAMKRGTGDETDGNSISRAEKRLERVYGEIGGEGDSEEEEGSGGREEGCIGAEPP